MASQVDFTPLTNQVSYRTDLKEGDTSLISISLNQAILLKGTLFMQHD